MAFSRDFHQVGAAAGKTVKVWNLADGKEVLTLTHPADVVSLSFSVDKTKIATAAADNLTRVWDVATRPGNAGVSAHAARSRAVVFHRTIPDVVVGRRRQDGGRRDADRRARGHPARRRRSCALAVDAQRLARADGRRRQEGEAVERADAAPNERVFDGSDKPLRAVAVSKNGDLVAAGGADQTVRLYNFADGKCWRRFKAPGVVRGLAFSPNNQTLAAACDDKSMQTWNVVYQPRPAAAGRLRQAVADVQPRRRARPTWCSPPTTRRSTPAAPTRRSRRGSSRRRRRRRICQHPNLVDAVAFNPAGTQLATGCHDGKVRIWDIAKGHVHQGDQRPPGMPPSPAAAGPPIYCVAWTPDGKQVLSGSLDHSLKLWDATSGTLVREFKGYKEKEFEKGHRDGVFSAAFSPDGKMLASGSSDRAIKIWNVADGSVVRELVNPNLKPAAPWPPQAIRAGSTACASRRTASTGERRRRPAATRLPGDVGHAATASC